MPRGKFLNHKGRSRQFTPVEELQREQELEGSLKSIDGNNLDESIDEAIFDGDNSNDNSNDKDNESGNGMTRGKKLGGAVEGLIEISNPNRPIKKSQKYALLTDEAKSRLLEDPLVDKRRRERAKEKPRSSSNQKTTSEANADLARLALVRKKREAAAEQRLAARKESNSYQEATPSTSKSDISVKKKTNKHKSVATGGTTDFLKKSNADNEHLSKFVKGRNGNKRNVSMQA
ncbi:28 kDa heat- and acid-stable phosphoprotein-like [Drosophila montana]|uniref:28 kDa heat- and acid-stable phosphoprotein-like n=1 Tax=Drosophila montana TaxID=40370 RepID=UPI00313B1453